MEEVIVIAKARGLLRDLGINSYPVDVNTIANEKGFQIKISDQLGPNEAGNVVRLPSRHVIVVNGKDLPYRQRFTILHEIAHEVLELPSSHGEKISPSQLESYASRPREEILCDLFAAECLVPWQLIVPLIEGLSYEISAIRKLSEDFQASITCVASRFAQASREMNVFVLAENGIIRNVVSSAPVREQKYWINLGIRLPKDSAAENARRARRNEASADSDGTLWSSSNSAPRFSCYEEAIALESWDQTLSLLTLEADQVTTYQPDHEPLGEDELLSELTGELPWPRR